MNIVFPEHLKFSDLRLVRHENGDVGFDPEVLAEVLRHNMLDPALLDVEDTCSHLITVWYSTHLLAGGDPDPVYEALREEITIEDAHGQHASFQPGRA